MRKKKRFDEEKEAQGEEEAGKYGGNQRRQWRRLARNRRCRLPAGRNRIKERYLFFHPFKNVLKCKNANGHGAGVEERAGEGAGWEHRSRWRKWRRRKRNRKRKCGWRKVDVHGNERGCWRGGFARGWPRGLRGQGGGGGGNGCTAAARPGEE